MLESYHEGNKKIFRADPNHPLYEDIKRLVRKHVGLDKLVDSVVGRLGKLEQVYLSGSLSRGLDSGIIDLVFVGDLDRAYLAKVAAKAESMIERKVRYIEYTSQEKNGCALRSFEPNLLVVYQRAREAVV